MQEEYENVLVGDTELNKKILKLGEFNELAYEDLILSINTNFSVEKLTQGLVRNAKSLFLEGSCKLLGRG